MEISNNELKAVVVVCATIMFIASVLTGVNGILRSGLLMILGGVAGLTYQYKKGNG